MARPPIEKIVENEPKCSYFKPAGLKIKDSEIIELAYEEFEALRLKDYLGLQQIEAAEEMGISQPTFNRIYNQSKKKIATAIIEGLAIKICGGNYKMPNRDGTGPNGEGPMTGRGLGNCEGEQNFSERNAQNLKRGFGRRCFGRGIGRGRKNCDGTRKRIRRGDQ